MEFSEVIAAAAKLSPFAHLATVNPRGEPTVVPVHPAWEGDVMWVMAFRSSAKARNVSRNPKVALHWQVDQSGDGVALWGDATVADDIDTKRRLWNGVFDYDLNAFVPDGPGSTEVVFIRVQPRKATVITAYGAGGEETWFAS